jgi:hypothetical protein
VPELEGDAASTGLGLRVPCPASPGQIDKLNYRLGPEQLTAEDKWKAAVMLAAAKD